jgi:hypothetical protein
MKLIAQSAAQVVATPAPPGTPQAVQITGSPAAIYRALRDQREILGDQLNTLQEQRRDLQREFDNTSSSNPGRAGIANRMQAIDGRIEELDKQISRSDQAVAQAAGVPGATVPPPQAPRRNGPDPDMVVGLSFFAAFIFLVPMSIAYARRIWRRSARTEVTLPPQVVERMEAIEQGLEAVALEVERIGEGQRFLTQAMQGRVPVPAVGAGSAEPVSVRAERGERGAR